MVSLHENLENDEEFAEDQEKDWRSIVFWANKVGCIKARESGDVLDEGFYNDSIVTTTWSSLLSMFPNRHMLISKCS